MTYRPRQKNDYQIKSQRHKFRNTAFTQRELAEAMASDLMTGGRDNVTVDRLSLIQGVMDIGGWSHLALTNQIERWLIGELTPSRKYDN